MEVKVTMKPTAREFRRRMRRVANEMRALTKPNREIATWLMRWLDLNFRQEGGKVGGWVPFASNNPRKRRDPQAKLLRDTGRLRASFAPFWSSRTAGIGSNLPYSQTHEEGTQYVPARRMLPRHTDQEVSDGIFRIYDIHMGRSKRKGRFA